MTTMTQECIEFVNNPVDWPSVYYDAETSIGRDNSPEPWDGAKIVMDGCLARDGAYSYSGTHKLKPTGMCNNTYVGHNIGFDFRHVFWTPAGAAHGWQDVRLIDTAINEYLISGQTLKFPSLEECCARHHIAFEKDDLITEYFEAGKGANIIIADGHGNRLKKYLEADVRATKALYISQVTNPANARLLPHFWVQGQASVIYSVMSLNGIKLDEDKLRVLHGKCLFKSDELEGLMRRVVEKELDHYDPDWKMTNRVFSTVLFNEPGVPYKEKRVVGKYKNGKPKFKTFEERAHLAQARLHEPELVYPESIKPNDSLGWPLGDKYLKKIIEETPVCRARGELAAHMPDLILKKRSVDKMANTYCEPLLGKHYRNGKVHGKIHSTITATGRTSSSNPNIQNQPEEIRRCMYGGLQFDVSQFELWGAAVLSGDMTLLNDVLNGDVHFETGKTTFGWTDKAKVPDRERRVAKALNFGLIFLATDKRLASEAGTDLGTAKRHRNSFKTRYHKFWNWAASRIDHVNEHKAKFVKMDPQHSVPLHQRKTESLTGRRLTFTEKWVDWKKAASISPSDAVNYHVQSFATADLFPLALINVFMFAFIEEFVPRAAVHDSALFDKPATVTNDMIAQAARYGIEVWPSIYGCKDYAVPPPKVDFKKGKHWS